jgi:TatD DNase family protein
MERAFLDAHLHLQDRRYCGRARQVIDRALGQGVRRMLCNGTSESDWAAVLELAACSDTVVPFLGIHPWQAETVSADWCRRLEELVRDHGCGLGEIGLDRRCRVDRAQQERVFLAQLDLACRYDRPLVIHCVQAWGTLIDLLGHSRSSRTGPPIMMHSFSGSLEIMERLTRMGVSLSFSMRLLDPGQQQLRQVFARVPLDRLLLETDAPDQSYDHQGRKKADSLNEPGCIIALYEEAARLRQMDCEQLSNIVWQNGSVFTHRKTIGP